MLDKFKRPEQYRNICDTRGGIIMRRALWATYVKERAKEKRVVESGNIKGRFVKGEMYITLQDCAGHTFANPASPRGWRS